MKRIRAFTLVEILLYISIVAMIIGVIVVVFNILLQARVKNQVIAEVEQQGTQIMELILQSARNAAGVNTPTAGTTDTKLSLAMTLPTSNPTVFDVANQVLRIKEGGSPEVSLSNQRISVTAFTVQNLAQSGANDSVRITLTLNHLNPENRYEYNVTKTFNGAATLR